MKVVQINGTCTKGSTGKICLEISKILTDNEVDNWIFHAQSDADYPLGISYCNKWYAKAQVVKAHILGNYGFNAKLSTKKLITHLKRIKPDIVHLHNIHSHECNVEMLFKYLKTTDAKVVWTFHDCWAFTAYCSYFDYVKCNKWKSGCEDCPQYKSKSIIFDRSKGLYERKREMLNGLDLTVVTPSDWLSELVGESFLKDCKRKVIHNGIDLNVFSKRQSDFKQKHNITGYMVLGVAYKWEKRKGIDVFCRMRELLGDEYTIVMVGTDEKVEKLLPQGIIPVRKTLNQIELAEIYSSADVFLNPTREDNFPTVNMEAIACGTPVVTFRTGGSTEMIDNYSGVAVNCDDIDATQKAIRKICEQGAIPREACIKKAREFDKNKCFSDYLALYKRLLSE